MVQRMSDIVWVDLEHEDVDRGDRQTAIEGRAQDGWTFYGSLDLIAEPDIERHFYTRPWADPEPDHSDSE